LFMLPLFNNITIAHHHN